jgi:hypothetical protein
MSPPQCIGTTFFSMIQINHCTHSENASLQSSIPTQTESGNNAGGLVKFTSLGSDWCWLSYAFYSGFNVNKAKTDTAFNELIVKECVCESGIVSWCAMKVHELYIITLCLRRGSRGTQILFRDAHVLPKITWRYTADVTGVKLSQSDCRLSQVA